MLVAKLLFFASGGLACSCEVVDVMARCNDGGVVVDDGVGIILDDSEVNDGCWPRVGLVVLLLMVGLFVVDRIEANVCSRINCCSRRRC